MVDGRDAETSEKPQGMHSDFREEDINRAGNEERDFIHGEGRIPEVTW